MLEIREILVSVLKNSAWKHRMNSSITGDEDIEYFEHISECDTVLTNAEAETKSEPESDYYEVVSIQQQFP